MFLIDDLRKLATDAGHAIDGEVHKFLTFVEEKFAEVRPHVSFGRSDPVQPTAAPAQVIVTRPSIVEQVAPAPEPVAEPATEPATEPVAEPATEPAVETPNEDRPGT